MKQISILVLAVLQVNFVSAQAWTQLADIPEKLAFPVVVELNNFIHVIGGGGPGGATSLHLRYDTTTNTWDTLAPVPYLAQQPGGSAVSGKIHYFGGGFPNSGTPLNSHYAYDPLNDTWDSAAILPAKRVIHKTAVLGDSIYVMGGQPDKTRFELYDASTDSWKQLAGLPDQNFWYSAIVTANDTIYRFGGGGFTSPVNTAQWYDVSAGSWKNLPSMPVNLHAPSAGVIGDSIYITGGYYAGSSEKVWVYDIKSKTYAEEFALPSPRSYHSVVSSGNCIYSLGGDDANSEKSLLRHCMGDSTIAGIESLPGNSAVKIHYASGKLHFSTLPYGQSEAATIEVFDLGGRKLMEIQAIPENDGRGEIELHLDHSVKIIIARICHGGQVSSQRIMIN